MDIGGENEQKYCKGFFWILIILTAFSVFFETMWGYEGATGEVTSFEAVYSIASDGLMLAAFFAYAYSKRWFGYLAVVLIMINTAIAGVYGVLSLLLRDADIMSSAEIVFLIVVSIAVYGVMLIGHNNLRREMQQDTSQPVV